MFKHHLPHHHGGPPPHPHEGYPPPPPPHHHHNHYDEGRDWYAPLPDEADLAILAPKREAFAGQVDSDSLGTYEELRRVKQGLAVAKLVQGRCDGCRISLPVSAQQKARAGQKLATCSNCGRILYVD